MNKQQLKQMPIKTLLDLLTDTVEESNAFIMLKSRHSALKNNEMMGIISAEGFNLERNKIMNSLFYYVDELSDRDMDAINQKLNPNDEKILINQEKGSVDIEKDVEKEKNETKKILFCASTPAQLSKLNVYKEYYELASKINNDTAKGNKFVLTQMDNTTPGEFIEKIIAEQPDYLHFAGHGARTDEDKKRLSEELDIEFEDLGGLIMHRNDYSGYTNLNSEVLSEMFFQFKKGLVPNLKYVILNACYAESQAVAISKHGFCTIGYSDEVKDASAINFTAGFYFGLGIGKSFENAIQIGKLRAITSDFGFLKLLKAYENGNEIKI